MYTSATLSLAALEMLVHVDVEEAPTDLVAVPVEIPDGLGVHQIEVEQLPGNWQSFPAPPGLQELGSEWARGLTTVVLSVPSAIVPRERNFVLNPAHRDFARLRTGDPEPFTFDPRLLK